MNDDQEFEMYRQPWTLFRVANGIYALPIAVVEEMVSLAEDTELSWTRLMRYREGVIPLLDARTLMGLPEDTEGDRTVVVMSLKGHRMGLIVDRMEAVELLPRRSAGIMEAAPGLSDADTPVNAIATHDDYGDMILCLDPAWFTRHSLPCAS